MVEPAYPAARAIAPRVQAQFAVHLATAGALDARPLLPDLADIEAIIDAAFWASLRREEGYVPKISLALLPPERAIQPLMFEQSLPLDPSALVKVAPAVERPGIHLGVWRQQRRAARLGHDAADPGLLLRARGRRRRACSSSSIIAARSASSSTSRSSKAIRSS